MPVPQATSRTPSPSRGFRAVQDILCPLRSDRGNEVALVNLRCRARQLPMPIAHDAALWLNLADAGMNPRPMSPVGPNPAI